MAKKKDKKTHIPKTNYQTPRSQIRSLKMTGAHFYLKNAREYPIWDCWVYADWEKSGISPVIVARKQSEDRVIFGVCLVDWWCLGIKDAFANADVSRSSFERNLPTMCSNAPQACSVEFAHELIYGAMEFAARYGFQPHKDFTRQMVDQVLDPPDMHPRTHNLQFGKDGKPFYASGPYDDAHKINRILRSLERTAGKGNYEALIHLGEPSGFFEEWDEEPE
jgi:hypothetical protein